MAHDELEMARRFQADLRALLKQYPTLTTVEAETRLQHYLSQHLEEETMPAEDTFTFTVRFPREALSRIDAYLEHLRRQRPWERIERGGAVRELVRDALDRFELATAAPLTLDLDAGIIEEASTTLKPDPPVEPKPGKARRGGSRKKARV